MNDEATNNDGDVSKGDGTAADGEEGKTEDQEANGKTEEEEPAVVLGDEFRTIDETNQDDAEEGIGEVMSEHLYFV